jgi:O-antigen/teichoic acid export membrane protein
MSSEPTPNATTPAAAAVADTADQDSKPSKSLRQRLMGASLWSTGAVLFGHVMRLGGNLVLTRILMPEVFGVMALVITIGVVVNLLSDIGLHQSIVRHPRGNERTFLNTIFTAQAFRGGGLFTLQLLLAAGLYGANHLGWIPAGSTYAYHELPFVLAVSAIGSIIHGFQSTKVHTAVRELYLRRTVLLELVTQATTIALMLLFAWWTKSIWSVVFAMLISTLLQTVLSHTWLPGPNNHFAWDREVLKDVVSYGKWLLVSSATGVIAMHADRLILAAYADARFLGLYSIALGLASAFSMIFERLFGSVFLPGFAEVARTRPEELVPAYLRARKRVDPILLMASGLLFAIGPLIIDVLYDERYHEAGEILSILALALILYRFMLVQQVYFVVDRPQYHAVLNVLRLVSSLTIIPAALAFGGLKWGLVAIALRELPTLPLVFWFNSKHGLNKRSLEIYMLLFWVVGFAVGSGLNELAEWVKS